MLLFAFISCGTKPTTKTVSLKDVFIENYMIGTAMSSKYLNFMNDQSREFVEHHFNTITPENELKWERVHPEKDTYNFEPADEVIKFGKENNMKIIGHVLVWHSQTSQWIYKNDESETADREYLLARMKDHIDSIAGRYKDDIFGWDVVNEAFNDDGSMRDTQYRQIIGDDYIEKAFIYASEAAPDCELYYNDYNMWKPGKVQSVVELAKKLQEKGIRIDGIGMQGHWGLTFPEDMREADTAIKAFSDLGLKVMISELDMRVLPMPSKNTGADVDRKVESNEDLDPYKNGFPKEKQNEQAKRYAEFFTLFNKYKDSITRVTFWGTHDAVSWTNNWPIPGRTEYPLLFDRELNPKPAFYSVINTLESN